MSIAGLLRCGSGALRVCLICVLIGLAAPARAQLMADPWVPWQSADSAHFRIHHRAAQRAQAEQVARAAERAYPRITQALQWEPRGRVEIVLFSEPALSRSRTVLSSGPAAPRGDSDPTSS